MIYHISDKTLIDPEPLRIRFDKIDGLIRIYDGTKHCLALKNITLFTTELDIL